MPSQDDVEKRLKVVLNDNNNQSCSECDRQENTPIWACFLDCPVDNKKLGVVCCKKCVKLYKKVDGAHFDVKSLKDLNDWTGDDIEALELGGNKLVNAAYEATVTSEKDGREKRKYGYEAFFFEKYVNLAHFDEVVYKNLINQASKALVEKRFNQNLRGYNLKKIANEDDDSHSNDDQSESNHDHDHDDGGGDSNEEENQRETDPRNRRSVGMQRANSSRSIRNRRGVSARAQSARNLRAAAAAADAVGDSGGGSRPSLTNTRPSLSRRRMDSLRRDLMEERENGNIGRAGGGGDGNTDDNNNKGRMRRKISARNLRVPKDDDDENGGGGGGGGGMRRSGSNRRLDRQGSSREERRAGMQRASSNSRLSGEGLQERERRHGRHRLMAS